MVLPIVIAWAPVCPARPSDTLSELCNLSPGNKPLFWLAPDFGFGFSQHEILGGNPNSLGVYLLIDNQEEGSTFSLEGLHSSQDRDMHRA